MGEQDPQAQAVDSAEVARLSRDLADVSEQFTATNEVLTALGQSAGDPDAVLGTIVESARRLCQAQAVSLYLFDGDVLPALEVRRPDRRVRELLRRAPDPLRPRHAGRPGRPWTARSSRSPTCSPTRTTAGTTCRRSAGFRTLIVGAACCSTTRSSACCRCGAPRSSRSTTAAIALLGAFAAQAAIVVRNVDLVRALEARSAELARKVDQLEALSEVGEAVSSSLDLDEVLSTIVDATPSGSPAPTAARSWSTTRQDRCFSVRCAYGSSAELLDRAAGDPDRARRHAGRPGRAGAAARSQVADLDAVDARPAPAGAVRRRLALGARRPDAPRGPDRRRAGRPPQADRRLLRRDRRAAARPSPASRRWPSSTPGCSASSRRKTRRAGGREPAQVRVPRQHVARAAHAAERRDRLLRGAARADVRRRSTSGRRSTCATSSSSGRHLLELLNEILDLSKVEAGRMELEPSTFSVRDALDYGARRWCASAPRSTASTSPLDVDPDVGAGRGRRAALQAGRAQPAEQRGEVHARRRSRRGARARRVERRPRGHRHRRRASASPPEDRERIFESFQQGRRGARRRRAPASG